MGNEKEAKIESTELVLEEFSIIELEDRLEFFPKCEINVKPNAN